MSKFRVTVYDDQANIDLSPMLDVVFIMLIFFIVVAAFVNETGLSVNLPEPSNSPQPAEKTDIRIVVEADGRYRINQRVVAPGAVSSYLQALHAENPEVIPTVFLQRGSLVKDAARALDAVHGIGIDVIPIVAID